MQAWFIIWNSSKVIHYVNRSKEEEKIICIAPEMLKNLWKKSDIIKIYNSFLKLHLTSWENTRGTSTKIKNKEYMPTVSTTIQSCPGSNSQGS